MQSSKISRVNLLINGVNCEVLIDSGASINILDYKTYNDIQNKSIHPYNLNTADTKLFAYSNIPIPLVRKFEPIVKYKCNNECFYVAKDASGCLFSYNSGQKLGIVNIVNVINNN